MYQVARCHYGIPVSFSPNGTVYERDFAGYKWVPVGDFRKKQDAIDACNAQPCKSTVTRNFTAHVEHDNGKQPGHRIEDMRTDKNVVIRASKPLTSYGLTMDIERLRQILAFTTAQFRKGEAIEGTPTLVDALKTADNDTKFESLPGGGAEIFMMPHVSEADPALKMIDVHFMAIGVDEIRAATIKGELINLLNAYPDAYRMSQGISYIEVGAELGDQADALRLFALGEALELWKVITPAFMKITGPAAEDMARNGFVMFSGFRGAKA